MKTYNPQLSAGEIYTVAGGNSFHLITATSGIDVQYLKADLTDINETATDVESGYFVNYPKDGFDIVKVTNGSTAQTIKFGVARDGQGGYNIAASSIVGGELDAIVNISNVDNDGAINHKEFSVSGIYTATPNRACAVRIQNVLADNQDVIIKHIELYSDSASATFSVNHLAGTAGVVGSALSPVNRNVGSADAALSPVEETPLDAASVSILTDHLHYDFKQSAYDAAVLTVASDIVIKPDNTLLIMCRDLNFNVYYNIVFQERATV